MDFASLLVPGAAPAVDPTALLGGPSAAPVNGEAFADLFAQAMVAVPTGPEAAVPASGDPAPGLPASTAALTLPNGPAVPGAAVLPSAPEVPALGASATGPSLDPVPLAEGTESTASTGPTVASEPKPEPRSRGEKIGKKSGIPSLPSCPTAPLLPDCPTAPLLPDCPTAPSGVATLGEAGLPAQGDGPEDAFALDAEESPEAGRLPLPGGATDAAPAPLSNAPLPNAPLPNAASTATVVVPGAQDRAPTKVDAIGGVAKPSKVLPIADDASSPATLPDAPDLGIVPQVTVTALASEAPTAPSPASQVPPAASPDQPTPTSSAPIAPESTSPTPVAPESFAQGPVSQAPAFPASISQPSDSTVPTAAPKEETGALAPVEGTKGRESAPVPKATVEPSAPKTETKGETKASLAEPVLEVAVQERKDDGEAPSGESPPDARPENVAFQPAEGGVRETAATARPEAGADRPAVDRHLVVKQVADRIENMVAARPRDGVTIHMEPRDLGTVTLVVKGLASALDVQVTASDERVRQSLDASRPELAQALAPRGIGVREIRVEHAPSTSSSSSSATADSGSGSSQNRSGGGSSQPQPKQSPAAFRTSVPAAPRPRASRTTGRGVDLLV